MRWFTTCAVLCGLVFAPSMARAAVIINEYGYDDPGTDEREFVELHNTGPGAVDISGWTVGGRDASTTNPIATIPAATSIPAGGYYVIGNTGVLNVNQVVAANFFENDGETIELRSGLFASAPIVDAVQYEVVTNAIPLPADVIPEVGPGYYGTVVTTDIAGGPPFNSLYTMGRYVDGRDTNNNGRDFGMVQGTPGTTNNPINNTFYNTPDPTGMAPETTLPGFVHLFVSPRVIDPTAVSASNLNAIPAPPTSDRAITAWDPSGGGNGVASVETLNTTESGYDLLVYIDTRNLPVSTTATTSFRSSEHSLWGIGGMDGGNFSLFNIGGNAGGNTDSTNGTSGVAWIYEKFGEITAGAGDVSEKLLLVDMGDGGDASLGGTRPLDWTVLASVDLSATTSGWYNLKLQIDALGNGVARFAGNLFNFTTAHHSGKFMVGYRENTQNGADGTPDAILRPPTWTVIPEPGTLALLILGLVGLSAARRR